MTLSDYNPTGIIYHKSAVRYLRELMHANLSPLEEQLVLLHCGMEAARCPMSFAALAELFHLDSAGEAETRYREAIAKTREAIPGSALENWLLSYQMAYHPERDYIPDFAGRPIPVWTGEETAT